MLQTKGSVSTNKSLPQTQAIKAIGILLGATLLVMLGYVWLTWQNEAWQQLRSEVIVLTVLTALVTDLVIGLVLAKQGYPHLAVWLAIFGIMLAFLAAAAYIADIGLILGILIVLQVSVIASQTLPPQQVNWAILISVGFGTVIILLDVYGLTSRLAIPPALQIFIPVVGVAVLIVCGYFVARQFNNYSLRTKFMILFLGVSVLSIGMMAYFYNQAITRALTEQVGTNLNSVANSVALAIGGDLNEQTKMLQSWASDPTLTLKLQAANVAYRDSSPADIKTKLLALNEKWNSLSNSDSEVRKILSNPYSLRLKQFNNSFTDHLDSQISDKYGAVMAASNRPADYYVADQVWWQAAYNNGKGAIYIGQPETDLSTATTIVSMAVPVYDPDSQVAGVLYSKYRLASLAEVLAAAKISQTGRINLLFPNSQILLSGGNNLLPVDPEIWDQLQASRSQIYAPITFLELVPSLASQVGVHTASEEPVVANLGWTVVAYQQIEEALAPIQSQQRQTVFWSLAGLMLATVIAVVISQRLVQPIVNLTKLARHVSADNLMEQAPVESDDEVGQLALAFNTMTLELRQTINNLEQKVVDRTRQLETVVQVSQQLTGILDLSDLLRQVVTLTKETFNYYHVHIYLLENNILMVVEGYGEAGAEMRRQQHNIALGEPKSLVARAAREGRIITVENVRLNPDWLPNPLLPDTHSEMAVPIILNREVIGVLDVQSEKVGGLTKDDEVTLLVLANQVATAARNARIFAQTQNALYEAQRLQHLYTGQAWEKLGLIHTTPDYEFKRPDLLPLAKVPTPEAVAALQRTQTVEIHLPVNKETKGKAGEPSAGEAPSALATPLKLRNQIIGVLGIHDENPRRRWTDDEIGLIESISEQMSLALENARLFEETGRRAGREKVIADVTRQVWASGEMERVMKTTVEQLGSVFDALKVVIRLGTPEQLLSSARARENGEAAPASPTFSESENSIL